MTFHFMSEDHYFLVPGQLGFDATPKTGELAKQAAYFGEVVTGKDIRVDH